MSIADPYLPSRRAPPPQYRVVGAQRGPIENQYRAGVEDAAARAAILARAQAAIQSAEERHRAAHAEAAAELEAAIRSAEERHTATLRRAAGREDSDFLLIKGLVGFAVLAFLITWLWPHTLGSNVHPQQRSSLQQSELF